MKKALIIDGHNYLFRSYYGVPSTAKLPNGIQVNAYYGFMSLMHKIYDLIQPKNIIVVFDSETGTKEKVLSNSSYKQNREYLDTEMFKQLPIIKQALEYLNIQYLEHPDYEGDDVIGSIAQQESKQGKVYIASQDKDFFQLINDSLVVVRTEKGKIVKYDKKMFFDKYGFEANRYLEYLSLVGDSSDNIKGVKGIGKKTAYKMITENDNLFENTDEKIIRAKKNYDFLRINDDLNLEYKFEKPLEEKITMKSNDILKALNLYQ